jgi:hypothetical protein
MLCKARESLAFVVVHYSKGKCIGLGLASGAMDVAAEAGCDALPDRLGVVMEATKIIREAVSYVSLMRKAAADRPELGQAIVSIKHFQARRFAGTYFDLLRSDLYRAAALFFLEELYSDKDYSERDAQFARIAGALERLFPEQVVQTAVSLAQLHRLTEDLDLAMAEKWMGQTDMPEVARYIAAWKAVGRRADRGAQLTTVMEIGHELDRLTRTPGLRMMLRMMRAPARLGGMSALQRFLEAGFDTFADMGRKSDDTHYFLSTVMARESALIDQLFDANAAACEAEITQILAQA